MATLTINGQKVSVDDSFLKLSPEQQNATVDEIAASLKPKGPMASAPQAGGATSAPAGPMEFLSHGMSGVNEGIANTLGLPVEAATWLINKGTSGINTLTGSQLPQIEHPFGGQETFRNMLAPTIQPESGDPRLQMTRRVGQEIGAVAVPGLGMAGRTAKPLQAIGKDLLAATGSGTGAAVAQQIAPGNPLAEMAGQVVGGMTPAGAARAIRGTPKPQTMSVDALRDAKNAAYKATEATGVQYSAQSYDNLVAGVAKEAMDAHISPTRHAAAYSFIEDMAKRRGKPMTLTELDQLRQEVRRDLITPSYGNPDKAADAMFGEKILDSIDEFIAGAKPGDLIAGNPKDAANAIITARSLNTRYRKTEMLQDAIDKARRSAASSGSGGNINNAIRQNIKSILNNPKKAKAFSAEERQMMEKLINQGKIEELLRWVGKFSPSGNGLMGMLQVGGVALNPSLAALPIAGLAAKGLADRGTLNKVAQLQGRVSTGAAPVRVPWAPYYSPSLLTGQAANGPLQITVGGTGGAR